MTGAFKLRRTETDYEIFTQTGFGYHLAIPNPYETSEVYCGGRQSGFDADQEIYEVRIESGAIFKIAIPCKIYEYSYLILLNPLRGTWLRKK